jgi:hypothetical protein
VAGFFLGCKLQIGGCKQPSVVEKTTTFTPPINDRLYFIDFKWIFITFPSLARTLHIYAQ